MWCRSIRAAATASGVERWTVTAGAGHQMADREARPVGPQVLGRARPDEVGLADDADEGAGGVDDRQAADVVAIHQLGGLLEGRVRADDDRGPGP